MDTKQTAIKNFESKNFHLWDHQEYKPPINDEKEIQKLTKELSNPNLSMKEKAGLELLLEEQKKGQPEILLFAKDYLEECKGLFKEENETLSISGIFKPENPIYTLNFHAKNWHHNTNPNHRLFNAGKLEIELTNDDKLKQYININKNKLNIPESVDFNSIGQCKIQIKPPYLITTKNENFEKAYSDIIKTINRLGYDFK